MTLLRSPGWAARPDPCALRAAAKVGPRKSKRVQEKGNLFMAFDFVVKEPSCGTTIPDME